MSAAVDPADKRDGTARRANDVDWAAIRARYPAATNTIYLGVASSSILSNAAKDAAEEIIRAKWNGDDSKMMMQPKLAGSREQFAKIINATADEIAVTKNVTEGLNTVASAIDWRDGDNMVFCPELEHPNNVYLWLALRKRGVEVRAVPAKDHGIDADAMVNAIDDRTRLVTASTVTFVPGFRAQLAKIATAAHESGALFMVDAVQSCGVVDTDVKRHGIDALATSTSKGLLGTTGLGFLYVAKEWIERLEPVYVGRYSVKRGEGHYSEFEGYEYELLSTAQRYEAGNYNWSGVAAAHESMAELLEIGVERIDERAVGLAESFADGLTALGLPVAAPPDGVERSHIVTVGAFGGGDTETTNDDTLDRVAQALKDQDVRFTIRKGMLRFAFHCYNDESDVARTLDIVRRAI